MSLAKPRPRMLEKADAKRERDAIDRAENAKVKARSGGQCEVIVVFTNEPPLRPYYGSKGLSRCLRRAGHVHHLIAGIGRRNRGASILAAHKLHVCEMHHSEIHGHALKPVNATEREAAATVRYERVR